MLVKIDLTDTSGYSPSVGDKVTFEAKNMIGSATNPGRVITTAPVNVDLVNGIGEVELEPGPHLLVVKARNYRYAAPITFTVPEEPEEMTLRELLEGQFEYDPIVVQEAQQYMIKSREYSQASEASATRAETTVGNAETVLAARTAAEGFRDEANASAVDAAASSVESAQSASDSAIARDTAVKARGESETARDAAAVAQGDATASADHAAERAEYSERCAGVSKEHTDTAWTARSDALDARTEAVAAKDDAVAANESAQVSATSAQGSAERVLAAEAAAESAQSAAESARDDAASSASASAQSASALSTSADASASSASASSTSASNAETSANNAAESEALALEHSQVTVGKITTGVEVIDLKDKFRSGASLKNVTSGDMPAVAAVVRCGSTCTLVLNRVMRDSTTWGEVLPFKSVPVEWLPVDADGNTLSFAGHLFCGSNGDAAELIVKQNGSVYVSSMVPGRTYSGSVSWPAPSMELPIADAVLDIKADVEASASAAANSEQSAFEHAQSAAQVAQLEVERLVNGAPEALDTLSELAEKLGGQQDAVAVLVSQISEKPSKEDVDAVQTTADAALPASKIQVVAALPESPVEGTIYLVTGA